jgi:hypothetical protein
MESPPTPSHNVRYIVPCGGAAPAEAEPGVGRADPITAEAELRTLEAAGPTADSSTSTSTSSNRAVDAGDELVAVESVPQSVTVINVYAQEGEPPLNTVDSAPAMLEPEPELEPVARWPGWQGLEDMPPDDGATQESPNSLGKGFAGYREAWIASEALMLAFHDDLVSTQDAHARSERELEELRTTSDQHIESLTAKREEVAAHVARLEAEAKARDAQLSLVQSQLAELRAEHEHEQGVVAEKQHQLETDLKAEQTTVALQGDVIAALRRVVSGP